MYLVTIQQYSLEAGRVGEHIGAPYVVSQHRSKRAAGRVLGSLISGVRAPYRKAFEGPRVAIKLLAFDTETGDYLPRNACK